MRSHKSKQSKPSTGRKANGIRDRFAKLRAFISSGQSDLREKSGASAVCLWFTLWSFEDATKKSVAIGRRKLAAVMGCDVRTVQRSIQELVDLGYLTRIKPGKLGSAPAVYKLYATPSEGETNLSPPRGDKLVSGGGDKLVAKEEAYVSPSQFSERTDSLGPATAACGYASGAAPPTASGRAYGESSATGTKRDPAALRWLFGKLTKSRTETISTDGLPADVLALFGHEDEINGPAPGIGARINRDKREIELVAY